jgi:hypothetical protein
MKATTIVAGQENTDGSCYSCCRTREYRRQPLFLLPDRTQMRAATPAAGQENTDVGCYSCCRTGEHR